MNFEMKKSMWIIALCCFSAAGAMAAKYKIKDLAVRPAAEYAASQDFQGLVIGAWALATQEEARQVFDTKKLIEKEILPVLVVVENNNDFAVRLRDKDIFLVLEDGANVPVLPLLEVLLKINLDKPLSSYSTRKEVLVRQVVKPEMFMDFEHKSFGEKLIAPHSSDHGVVFFPYPSGEDLEACRLYFPEIVNLTEDQPMMFFEFPLKSASR